MILWLLGSWSSSASPCRLTPNSGHGPPTISRRFGILFSDLSYVCQFTVNLGSPSPRCALDARQSTTAIPEISTECGGTYATRAPRQPWKITCKNYQLHSLKLAYQMHPEPSSYRWRQSRDRQFRTRPLEFLVMAAGSPLRNLLLRGPSSDVVGRVTPSSTTT